MTGTELRKMHVVRHLLNTADELLQEVLPPGDECYDLHNRIQDFVDEVSEYIKE